MERRFKLKKPLPDSKDGDVYIFKQESQGNQEAYYRNGDIDNSFWEKDIVENNPEWFEEIFPLAMKYKGEFYYRTPRGGYKKNTTTLLVNLAGDDAIPIWNESELPKEPIAECKGSFDLCDMSKCFEESRLTHPLAGFKHDTFKDYMNTEFIKPKEPAKPESAYEKICERYYLLEHTQESDQIKFTDFLKELKKEFYVSEKIPVHEHKSFFDATINFKDKCLLIPESDFNKLTTENSELKSKLEEANKEIERLKEKNLKLNLKSFAMNNYIMVESVLEWFSKINEHKLKDKFKKHFNLK